MNFTVQDLLSTAMAAAVFPLFIVLPGYLLGWLLNLLDFRRQTPLIRLLLSLPLSVSLTPVIVDLLGRKLSFGSVWIFYGLVWLTLIAMLAAGNRLPASLRLKPGGFPAHTRKPVFLIATGWILTAGLSLADLQIGQKLFYSAVGYDYTVRSAAVSQLARAAWLPPSSPFFYPHHATPFRYHYYWFLIVSLPDRIAHGTFGPRQALMASVIWAGFTLMASVALYLRFFCPEGASRIRRRTLVALGLLCVSGLDIVPNLVIDLISLIFHKLTINPSLDWWNNDQVTGWLDTAFWVPHHLAAVIACFTGFLILWVGGKGAEGNIRWQSAAAAGLAFGSAVGLSVYVTLVFAGSLCVWGVVLVFRKNYSELIDLAFAGALAGILAMPYTLDLLNAGTGGSAGHGASFVRLGVRQFTPVHILMFGLHRSGSAAEQLLDSVMIPLNLFLELGAFFVIGGIKVRRWMADRSRLAPADLALAVLLGSALSICLAVRSNTIDSNDLGMRGMLIVQFVLLLWGVDVVSKWSKLGSAALTLKITICLGLATTAAELAMLRGFSLATDAGFDPGGRNLITHGKSYATQLFASREAYEWLAAHIPQSAVEQPNPFTGYYDLIPGLYANRQMSMSASGMARSFGANPAEVERSVQWMSALFETAADSATVDRICREAGIDYLIATSTDRIWKEPRSWVWLRKPVYENSMVRAVACGQ
jgi:hypothetical protein